MPATAAEPAAIDIRAELPKERGDIVLVDVPEAKLGHARRVDDTAATGKGKHITSYLEMFPLDGHGTYCTGTQAETGLHGIENTRLASARLAGQDGEAMVQERGKPLDACPTAGAGEIDGIAD